MPETVGIGLLGLGTVGSAVAARLITEWELLAERAGATPVLRRVAVRDVTRTRNVDLRSVPVGGDPAAVIDDPSVNIVVEVMGGVDPATSLIERALRQGKTVVTANKAVIATSGPRLAQLATARGAGLYFEASVGAGLPVVTVLQHALGGDRISRIDAVINGTTNVILTRMRQDGISFDSALHEAQQRGYAEADPTSDIDGWDAAYKLVIMCWLAFGADVPVDQVDRQGIRSVELADLAYTGQLGYSIKLVAHAQRREGSTAVHLRVRPTAVPSGHPLFGVDDSDNAVIISSDLARSITLSGLAAGAASTASAVVGDVVSAVRQRDRPPPAPPAAAAKMVGDEDVDVAGYVRLQLDASPDARALVLQALEDRGVQVVDAVDKPAIEGRGGQLLVLTGAAPRAVHDRALETVDTLAAVREISCSIDRIEPVA